MNTMEVQRLLAREGFDPGPIDGIRGRRTIAAVKRFQSAHGLLVDGIVGQETANALRGTTAPIDAKPCLVRRGSSLDRHARAPRSRIQC